MSRDDQHTIMGHVSVSVSNAYAYRPFPALKLFREKMFAALSDKLPADMWDYSA